MKTTKFFFYMAVAGVMAIASCKGGGKPDEAAMKEMSDFEADWGAATAALKSWDATLHEAMTASKTMSDSMAMGECEKDKKGTCDSLKNGCASIQTEMAEMETKYKEAVAAADENGKKWAEWSEKAKKGEVKEEDRKHEMENWNNSLMTMKGDMESWNKRLEELKTKCVANCTAMADCCKKADMKGKK